MLYYPEDVANARRALGRLWPLLRPGLWHSTPAGRYGAILGDGEIKPDGGPNGNVYRGSFAVSINAVSLFDFENASEDDGLGIYTTRWSTHLRLPDTPVTVWIGLHRDRLPGRLILADEGSNLAHGKWNWYPRVEACHVGLVPACAFAGVLAVSTAKPHQFETLVSGAAALPRLRELAEQWPNPESPEVRHLRAGRDRDARREAKHVFEVEKP